MPGRHFSGLVFAKMWKNYFHLKIYHLHLDLHKVFRTTGTCGRKEKAAMPKMKLKAEETTLDVFEEAEREVAEIAQDSFPVRPRGRPKTPEEEARRRDERRVRFGAKLRQMREARGLTLAEAAQKSRISSPRKLSQYETICYPPGNVVRAIAPVYGVSAAYLAELVLKHNDPDLHQALMSQIEETVEDMDAPHA